MPLIASVHLPLFVTIKGSSAKEPTQTLPKLPVFAMIRFALGGGAVPETRTVCGLAGSSLKIVITPDFAPKVEGWNRSATSIESPAPTTIGNERTLGTRKS